MKKEKLLEVRKRKGITQQQLADLIATDVSNYSRKESGDVKIIKDEWDKIARYLDVAVEDIFRATNLKNITHRLNLSKTEATRLSILQQSTTLMITYCF